MPSCTCIWSSTCTCMYMYMCIWGKYTGIWRRGKASKNRFYTRFFKLDEGVGWDIHVAHTFPCACTTVPAWFFAYTDDCANQDHVFLGMIYTCICTCIYLKSAEINTCSMPDSQNVSHLIRYIMLTSLSGPVARSNLVPTTTVRQLSTESWRRGMNTSRSLETLLASVRSMARMATAAPRQ